MEYVVEVESLSGLISCLPDDVDKAGLINVSKIGSRFITYIDPTSGMVYESEEFYLQMQKLHSQNV